MINVIYNFMKICSTITLLQMPAKQIPWPSQQMHKMSKQKSEKVPQKQSSITDWNTVSDKITAKLPTQQSSEKEGILLLNVLTYSYSFQIYW